MIIYEQICLPLYERDVTVLCMYTIFVRIFFDEFYFPALQIVLSFFFSDKPISIAKAVTLRNKEGISVLTDFKKRRFSTRRVCMYVCLSNNFSKTTVQILMKLGLFYLALYNL